MYTQTDGDHNVWSCVNINGVGTWNGLVPVPNGGGSGNGTVTSVGVNFPSIFCVAGTNPVTTSGIIIAQLCPEPANTVFAGPASGSPGVPGFRNIFVPDLPFTYSGNTTKLATVNGATTAGITLTFDANGNIVAGGSGTVIPGSISASQVTGLAPSATIDTTNANNITSGHLSLSVMPTTPFTCPAGMAVTGFVLTTTPPSCTGFQGVVNQGPANSLPTYISSGSGTSIGPSTATLDVNGNLGNVAALGVTGNATIGGTLGVTGALTAGSLSTSGTLTAGAATVASLTSSGAISGTNITASGTLQGATLSISGNAAITGTLGAGATTVTGLTVNGNASITGTLGAGATTVASLTSSGAISGTTITGTGLNITGSFPANQVYASPNGSAGNLGLRSIVTQDLPFTYSGNTTKLGTVSGTLTQGNLLTVDANGNIVTTGSSSSCTATSFSNPGYTVCNGIIEFFGNVVDGGTTHQIFYPSITGVTVAGCYDASVTHVGDDHIAFLSGFDTSSVTVGGNGGSGVSINWHVWCHQ
jgi:hypothetical protein